MKILLVLVGLICAVGAGAMGAALFAPSHAPAQQAAVMPAPVQPGTAALPPEVRERIDALAMEVADLQSRLERAQSGAQREAVATPAAEEAPKVDASSVAFAALHRDAILKVIADDRAEQDRLKEEERNKRDAEQRQARADRMAQKFNLTPVQSKQLADFYAVERNKRDEMRAQFDAQGGPGGGDPQTMRDAFRQYGDWREAELVRQFGDVGKQISDADNQRFQGGPGGGGRRGGGGQGGGGQSGGAGQAGGGGF